MQEIPIRHGESESGKARSIKDHTLSNKYSSICCWVVTPCYNTKMYYNSNVMYTSYISHKEVSDVYIRACFFADMYHCIVFCYKFSK